MQAYIYEIESKRRRRKKIVNKFTWQIVAKCHRLFQHCQNLECPRGNDSIFSSPNQHNTKAIDLNRNQMQTKPMYR